MSMDFDTQKVEQELRLGIELLDMAIRVTDNPEKLKMYNEILVMPGVDSALYMLYSAAQEGTSHPKSLLQSAFMLGYYIYESLHEMDKLWKEGPVDDPS